jgi:nicotinamide-nucleotide amidase
VAVAESLTGGLLTAALTDIPGASATVRGGLVVYATDLKAALAGVPDALLAEHGPVHADVASALADGARSACGADWGVGITGVAGPEPQGGQPVGTVWVGVAGCGHTTSSLAQLTGDRTAIRSAAVEVALTALLQRLCDAEEAA